MPPSVTTSSRFVMRIGMTEVIGSTPVDVDLVELLDEGRMALSLALQMRHLVFGHRDAGQMRDAADGRLIDRHGVS